MQQGRTRNIRNINGKRFVRFDVQVTIDHDLKCIGLLPGRNRLLRQGSGEIIVISNSSCAVLRGDVEGDGCRSRSRHVQGESKCGRAAIAFVMSDVIDRKRRQVIILYRAGSLTVSNGCARNVRNID